MLESIPIMVNGLPGKMAEGVVERAIADSRFRVAPLSLTGPDIADPDCVVGGLRFRLIRPEDRRAALVAGEMPDEECVMVDFTHPSAVNDNAEFYSRHGYWFVMGTTGGDRKALVETVTGGSVSAVIAPNMAKQIVGLQAMMAWGAATFPGLFDGYRLCVRESHQRGKADTSGTAKAMVEYFNRMGLDFSPDQIEKERDPQRQAAEWGVPEAYLTGHGWHTYTIDSPDETARFVIQHNINGRDIYARGTLDAIAYLDGMRRRDQAGRVFSMIDVLKGTE